MSLFVGSRYSNCAVIKDAQGRLFLSDREPYGYKDHKDNHLHTVLSGESLFTLAARYFSPLPRACGYWWAIADFQPEPEGPILDPTLDLSAERPVVVIPSLRVLTDILLGHSHG